MAIVTKYVYDKLVGSIDSSDLDIMWTKELFEDKIYNKNNLFFWFNKLERNRLYIYRHILENNGRLETLNMLKEEPDTLNYVFMTGGKLKFHHYPDCYSFKEKYLYFKIPPEISEEKTELVSTFRGWFKTRKFKEKVEEGEITDRDILKLYNEVFSETHSLKKLSKFNFIEESKISGLRELLDSFNLESFEIKMKELVNQKFHLCHSKSLRAISRLDFLKDKNDEDVNRIFKEIANQSNSFTEDFIDNFGLLNLRKFWKEHYYIKHNAEKLLKEYFRWTYNFNDVSFNIISLENFGLKSCKICDSRQVF